MKKIILSLTFSLLSIVSAHADTMLNTQLSNDFVGVTLSGIPLDGNLDMSAGYFNDVDDGSLSMVGISVGDKKSGINIDVGVQVYAAFIDHESGDDMYSSGVALGIGLERPLTKDISVKGGLYMSPKVVSFGDAESMVNTSIFVEYQIIRNASAGVGYTYTGLKPSDEVDHDDTVSFGDGLKFSLSMQF